MNIFSRGVQVHNRSTQRQKYEDLYLIKMNTIINKQHLTVHTSLKNIYLLLLGGFMASEGYFSEFWFFWKHTNPYIFCRLGLGTLWSLLFFSLSRLAQLFS